MEANRAGKIYFLKQKAERQTDNNAEQGTDYWSGYLFRTLNAI
jgi:hypothetical protein